MKRRFLNWLYRRIDERGRIPRWVTWIWRSAHWCPDMDYMLVIDNTYDCFCGYAKQKMLICPRCGDATERRFTDASTNMCLDCIPTQGFDHDPTSGSCHD